MNTITRTIILTTGLLVLAPVGSANAMNVDLSAALPHISFPKAKVERSTDKPDLWPQTRFGFRLPKLDQDGVEQTTDARLPYSAN